MDQKITNVKLIENGKVELEITKTVVEKVVLDQSQLLGLTQGNQIKSLKDNISGDVLKGADITVKNKDDKSRLSVRNIKPFELKIELDKTLNEDLVKEAVKKIQDDINKNTRRSFYGWA